MFHPRRVSTRSGMSVSAALAFLLLLVALPAAPTPLNVVKAARAGDRNPQIPFIAPGSAYRQTNLVSDAPGLAPVFDALLVNPWGVATRSGGPFWVVDNGNSTARLFRGIFGGGNLVLNESLPAVSIPAGMPMALVANTTGDFNVSAPGGSNAPAHFIFSVVHDPFRGSGGRLAAWQPALGNTAQGVGPSTFDNFDYAGLAIGSNADGNRLYAAEFPRGIDVYDAAFASTTVSGGFLDPT